MRCGEHELHTTRPHFLESLSTELGQEIGWLRCVWTNRQ